jgi:phosphatidylglycerol:prolipoprotein diacylglycerol transferase
LIWDVNREIFSIGGFALRWYSLLFALGIFLGYTIMYRIFQKEDKPIELMDSLLFHIVIGTVVGARLGHCLFYEPMDYLTNPIRILKVWEGGLASHGGFTGVIIALILYCRRYPQISFFWLADRMTFPAMLAAGCIRIGNLFNSEIYGHKTDVAWAFIFKKIDDIPRHPTQIYESIGYLSISAILYIIYRLKDRKPTEGSLFGLVMIMAYSFRTYIETFKENQVAFEDNLTLNMGQLLSIPFVLFGFFILFGGHRKLKIFHPGLTEFKKVPAKVEEKATKNSGKSGKRKKTNPKT